MSPWGLTPGFPGLSPARGQVAHVLLTRPPRSTPEGVPVRLACIRHAASVVPEPGSNSPSWLPDPRRRGSAAPSRGALTRVRLPSPASRAPSTTRFLARLGCALLADELHVSCQGAAALRGPKKCPPAWRAAPEFTFRVSRPVSRSAAPSPLGARFGWSVLAVGATLRPKLCLSTRSRPRRQGRALVIAFRR